MATKSGYFITILIWKHHRWCKMNQPQTKWFTKKRLCCDIGGIIKEFCTLNFYQETKHLIQTCTFNNLPKWAMQFKKSSQHWQIVKVLFSSMVMQNLLILWSLAKKYWNKVECRVLSHPTYSPDVAPSDYHLFRFNENSLKGKTFNDATDVKSHLIHFLLSERREKFPDKNRQHVNE